MSVSSRSASVPKRFLPVWRRCVSLGEVLLDFVPVPRWRLVRDCSCSSWSVFS